MSLEQWLFWAAFACFIAGAAAAWTLRRKPSLVNRAAHGLAAVGSLFCTLCALFVIISQKTIISASLAMPLGEVYIRIDPLSAWFMLALGIVGSAAGVYALSYSREYYGQAYFLLAGLFNLFLLTMLLVFSAAHAASFLIAWELMAIVSFLLVNFEHEKSETRRAAFIYLVMTHIGAAFLIAAFFMLGKAAGSLDFVSFTGALHDQTTRNVIFICVLIGFGAKAGMIPLHIWLPRAHPAAPSHVSALMSGVMLKTAIYGLCRFFLDFLGAGPAWWGYVVLLFAAITAFLGVLYALMENDFKKLLAYSSVENIGIILLGIGAGLVFSSQGHPALAAFAWTAALFHSLNHAVFKSLLFMVAGSILQATHTRDLERLGGLIQAMPVLGIVFFIGCASIGALPPLNGFASEWMTLQSLFFLPQVLPGSFGRLAGMLLTAILGLTGALAAACFVKAFGIACLGKPRSHQAKHAAEPSFVILLPLGMLTAICLALGLAPQLVISQLQDSIGAFAGLTPAVTTGSIALFQAEALAAPLGIAPLLVLLAASLAFACLLYRLFGRPNSVQGETWTCGIDPSARMQYTATGFSEPVRRAFGAILQPRREVLSDSNANIYFGRKLYYHSRFRYILSETLYRPLHDKILRFSHFMKRLQVGNLQVYIGYIMAVTVLTLLWSARWQP